MGLFCQAKAAHLAHILASAQELVVCRICEFVVTLYLYHAA